MDKQQRGTLLVDQEETQKKISSIKGKLAVMGQFLKDLGDAILLEPENIVFPDAKPTELGKAPLLKNPRSFNWDKFPKKEDIAQLIQDLRHEQYRLSDIQRSL